MREAIAQPLTMKKILYVHYQRSERDGSYVHTREFETAFGAVCRERGIIFGMLSPRLVSHGGSGDKNTLQRLKHWLAQHYLRDIKLFLQQVSRTFGEWKMLRRERPDIVLTRYDGKTLSILWACRLAGIPSVIEINSPDRDEESDIYRHLPILSRLFTNRHALELAQGAFAVSDLLAQPLRAHARGKTVATISNGVDIVRFNPAIPASTIRRHLGIDEQATVIGFVGSFAPWHGLDLLVDAFSKLLPEFPHAHLLLVGQPNPKWQALLDRLDAPELAPHASIVGFVAPADIPPYLAAMDITTLPNTAYYCSPLKLFEYMAMARPSVCVDTPPVADTIHDEHEGLLFPQNDLPALENALRRLLRDAGLRHRLGSASRARAEREYTWRHNALQVFDLLQNALARASARE